jgi:hypothetical protein
MTPPSKTCTSAAKPKRSCSAQPTRRATDGFSRHAVPNTGSMAISHSVLPSTVGSGNAVASMRGRPSSTCATPRNTPTYGVSVGVAVGGDKVGVNGMACRVASLSTRLSVGGRSTVAIERTIATAVGGALLSSFGTPCVLSPVPVSAQAESSTSRSTKRENLTPRPPLRTREEVTVSVVSGL